jgi:DNA-binding MarR family transcriptional regulator
VVKTAWLSHDEQRTWRAFLATTELLDDAIDRHLQSVSGLTRTSYVVLAVLSETPGRALRMSDLARQANSSQSRLSHVVARLEERGWVRRQQCPTDRRGQVAVLTDTGYDLLATTAPCHVETVRRLFFDPLSQAQIRELGVICRAVLTALNPAGS